MAEFTGQAPGPVNVRKTPRTPAAAELAALGVARISYGSLLHHDAMRRFADFLASLAT